MTKKKKKGGKKLTASELQIFLLRFLLAHPKKRLTARQIIDHLSFENNKDSVEYALRQLAQAGSVREYEDNKFGVALERLTREEAPEPEAEKSPAPVKAKRLKETPADPPPAAPIRTFEKKIPRGDHRKLVEGRVDMTRSGAAYIVSELQDTDVYVAPKYLNGALHGDTVRVALFPSAPRRRGLAPRKPEGEVLEVLRRANEFFIGTLRKSRKYALLLPDNPNMPVDIYVPLEAVGQARDGDKVVVRVTDWQEGKGRAPIGKVTQTLGEVGGNEFEMKKILINAGFELDHSEEALAEAARIPERIPEQEIAMRRDFREVLTFTIDPEDAKDFDDALSIRKLDNGNLEVGVHIADVTHYLKPDSPMDQEAFRRSTSVYLVDRVNPMLPEKLSNNLCSLVPYQDRLTFSAVFEFDGKDKLVKRWFGKTVIHSAHRFAYEEAQTILDKKPAEALTQLAIYPQLEWAIGTLDRLAKKMRKEREKNGAIGFESEEIRFRLGPDGTPIEAYVKERKDAHLLIEDFMLLANKEVAWFIDQKGAAQQEVPFVYRIHDLPDMEKVAEFARFAAELGYPIKVDTPKQIAQAYNGLMVASRKNERLKLLEPLAIRTMAKAVYSPDNIGHYGLGFTHYAHFTSPIRRYADVLAHRILERNLEGRTWRVDKTKLAEQCKHISNQEKKAADAERESVKYKQAELVRRHIGEEFEGIVSGFLDRGFFVTLPDSHAEGLVEFKYLADQWVVDEGNLRARTRRGRQIKMGDRVRVRIVAVDLAKRQIEMEWAE
ncbi:MAG: ribonuclease R [Saprospiraceae bacterium]|nr:ribonuclease R [Saprospiraceae bacterium]